MKIGFTGTRAGMSSLQKLILERIFTRSLPDIVHHGGCIGADTDFHNICLNYKLGHKLSIIIFPSNLKNQQGNCPNPDYRHKDTDPLARNKVIVTQSDILIAAPHYDTEELRSGTWATIRYARKIGVPVVILPRGESNES